VPLGVAGCFAPGRQQVDALLGLALAAGFGRMHVDAVGAAVDLRGADLDEFHQARLEAGGDRERRAGPHLHDVGGGGEEINLNSHWTIPFVSSDDMTSSGPSIVTSRRKNCVVQIPCIAAKAPRSCPLWVDIVAKVFLHW